MIILTNGVSFSLAEGAIVIIVFSKGVTIAENQNSNFTLNINSSGAKNFTPHNLSNWGHNGTTSWDFYNILNGVSNAVSLVVYNGSKYQAISSISNHWGSYSD